MIDGSKRSVRLASEQIGCFMEHLLKAVGSVSLASDLWPLTFLHVCSICQGEGDLVVALSYHCNAQQCWLCHVLFHTSVVLLQYLKYCSTATVLNVKIFFFFAGKIILKSLSSKPNPINQFLRLFTEWSRTVWWRERIIILPSPIHSSTPPTLIPFLLCLWSNNPHKEK